MAAKTNETKTTVGYCMLLNAAISVVRKIVKFTWIIGLVLCIPAIVVHLPLLLFSILTAKLLRPNIGPIVQGTSLAFMTSPPEDEGTNIIHVLVLQECMSAAEFCRLFDERVIQKRLPNGQLAFPHFQNTWTEHLFHTFWKPERYYSTARHVRDFDYEGSLKLPQCCSMNDVELILGPLASKCWPAGMSPWEILLVQDYKVTTAAQPATVLLFRHSHALIDGYGLVSVIRELSQSKYELPKPNFPKLSPLVKALALTKVPYYLGPDSMDAPHESHWVTKDSGPSKLISSTTELIPVEKVKQIKKKLGVSYATVLFAAAAGALERVMAEEKINIPDSIDIWTASPLPGHPGGTVNHVASIRVTLKIRCESSLKRLRIIEKNFQASRAGIVPVYLSNDLKNLFMILMPTPLRRLMINTTVRPGSALTSIFPVTDEIIAINGNQVLELSSTIGSFGNSALSVVITGLSGKHRVIATFDTTRIPAGKSLRKFGRYFESELEQFLH